MASADFSRPLPTRYRAGSPAEIPNGQNERPPRVSTASFPRNPPDLPPRLYAMSIGRPHVLEGYPSEAALYPISVRRVRVSPQLPSDSASPTDALAYGSRFRSSRPVEDLHLLETEHAWHTNFSVCHRCAMDCDASYCFAPIRRVRRRNWSRRRRCTRSSAAP